MPKLALLLVFASKCEDGHAIQPNAKHANHQPRASSHVGCMVLLAESCSLQHGNLFQDSIAILVVQQEVRKSACQRRISVRLTNSDSRMHVVSYERKMRCVICPEHVSLYLTDKPQRISEIRITRNGMRTTRPGDRLPHFRVASGTPEAGLMRVRRTEVLSLEPPATVSASTFRDADSGTFVISAIPRCAVSTRGTREFCTFGAPGIALAEHMRSTLASRAAHGHFALKLNVGCAAVVESDHLISS